LHGLVSGINHPDNMKGASMDRWEWFVQARFGLFVHYGLYSLLERSEWVLNREQIPIDEYRKLANRFTAEKFDADAICDLAVRAGMKYIVFTTMHHDGFCLYDTELTDFNSARTAAGRDLIAEVVGAARTRNLKIGLYHSLNHWTASPDAVAALESRDAYEAFIQSVHDRIRELVTRFNPIDTLWYDGWWPFNAEGWQSEKMNAMVREIQPHILFNGRNCLPGDFATPEQHLTPPNPWRPWEACMTLNNSWGFHRGDRNWKSSKQVIHMLSQLAAGKGNLLLNVGPRGDGSIPDESVRILEEVGGWMEKNGESLFGTDLFTYGLQDRGDHRNDWNSFGLLTARGNSLFWLVEKWVGNTLTRAGLECAVRNVTLLGDDAPVEFSQSNGKVTLTGLPQEPPDPVCPVLRLDCDGPPSVYLCGGMRTPNAPHPHYDPVASDIAH